MVSKVCADSLQTHIIKDGYKIFMKNYRLDQASNEILPLSGWQVCVEVLLKQLTT